ncbi:MAG: single-stranded-DNA-specific exonuclease RecJ [Alphaproteobacteria bacterium]|nr:single-stranded-DNA-specific exonuclease RecJ [Alphaproteobacteria bacterium]
MALGQRHGLPELVCRVLAGRGVDLERAATWLDPRLRDHLPDPALLVDMDKAVARLVVAVEAGEGVAVFGDYDVDGATATALLLRYFGALGLKARAYIPDRLAEGYGPNSAALLRLGAEGWRLVVTVDCGTMAHGPLADAAQAGIDVIVIDHHQCDEPVPDAIAVVNPRRAVREHGPLLGDLAAVGVAFMLTVAVNRALRERGWFGQSGRPEPDLLGDLDLVALGTVCDSVPLTGLNRALVGQGLKRLAGRGNTGLAALADIALLKDRPTAYHLGFVLGPRINAGGRVGEAGLGARLLATGDPGEALTLARQLDEFNRERQRIEADVLQAALDRADRAGDAPFLLVAGEGWHPGVIGIVASRLVERTGRPACVVALGEGLGKGSGRSVPGFDLGRAVLGALAAGLLEKGGGHAMAAGFEVRADRLPALAAYLAAAVPEALSGARARRQLELDGTLRPAAATGDLIRMIEQAGPYGMGNPEPCFVVTTARVVRADTVGQGHVRCVLADSGGGGRLKAIAFRVADGPLGAALLQARGQPLHVAGRLRADTWEGRDGAQLMIEDAAPAGSGPA